MNIIKTNNHDNDNYGITELNGVPVVSSRVIANKFNKNHQHVLRDIETALRHFDEINQSKFGQINFQKSTYKDNRNRKQPEYLLTRDGFSYIAMGFTGKKATKFKVAYINRFNEMEKFILSLAEAKAEFPEFTQAIMLSHEEPKHYHFSNEVNMINRIVLGMDAKKFKEVNNLRNVNSIRPYLKLEQIEAIRTLQRVDIGLCMAVPEYQERKKILQDYHNKTYKRKQIGA